MNKNCIRINMRLVIFEREWVSCKNHWLFGNFTGIFLMPVVRVTKHLSLKTETSREMCHKIALITWKIIWRPNVFVWGIFFSRKFCVLVENIKLHDVDQYCPWQFCFNIFPVMEVDHLSLRRWKLGIIYWCSCCFAYWTLVGKIVIEKHIRSC